MTQEQHKIELAAKELYEEFLVDEYDAAYSWEELNNSTDPMDTLCKKYWIGVAQRIYNIIR